MHGYMHVLLLNKMAFKGIKMFCIPEPVKMVKLEGGGGIVLKLDLKLFSPFCTKIKVNRRITKCSLTLNQNNT